MCKTVAVQGYFKSSSITSLPGYACAIKNSFDIVIYSSYSRLCKKYSTLQLVSLLLLMMNHFWCVLFLVLLSLSGVSLKPGSQYAALRCVAMRYEAKRHLAAFSGIFRSVHSVHNTAMACANAASLDEL